MPARERVKEGSSDVLSFYLPGSTVTFGRSIRGRRIEALWLLLDEILYQCDDFNWVPLVAMWGAVGYAPLLVLSGVKRFKKKRTRLIDGKGNSKRSRREMRLWRRVCSRKIEEMKERIGDLETILQNCEIQIEYLEANEDRQNEQLHYFQNQVRNRDHIMEEAVVQIREVADYLQTLVVQADTLSVKYELESNQG
ncbi:hypothetical protein Goshw_000102 [Gossypium schwendimanii]|uniref:Uncharacterized protein n=2 Tax=Gossypium schwendimanii TaxID=34291 RepID=A0A7J9MAK8_GOSSC|nr:hypothetical protein [Gossypium schwendimanii]